MKLIVHSKPSQRGSWDPHGVVGFYVQPAMQHYCCFTCYIPSTKSERITDAVAFLPHNIPIPTITLEMKIQKALQEKAKVLASLHKSLSFICYNKDTIKALQEILPIF